MEETSLNTRQGDRKDLLRLTAKAAGLGVVAFLLGIGASGLPVALGALGGCVVAGAYCWVYIASHLSRAQRERFWDGVLAGQTGFRILALAVVSAAVFLAGRAPFLAYLLAFAIAFLVLLISEAPRVTKELRARGMIGGGR
jgi:hypothetical protein